MEHLIRARSSSRSYNQTTKNQRMKFESELLSFIFEVKLRESKYFTYQIMTSNVRRIRYLYKTIMTIQSLVQSTK